MKKRLFIMMAMATIGAMSISASIENGKNLSPKEVKAPSWPFPSSDFMYPKLPVFPISQKEAKYPKLPSWPHVSHLTTPVPIAGYRRTKEGTLHNHQKAKKNGLYYYNLTMGYLNSGSRIIPRNNIYLCNDGQ